MKISFRAAAGLLVLLAAGSAFGGAVSSIPVSVSVSADGSGTASGDMRSARRANNTVEYISCRYASYESGASFGGCQASSSDGTIGFCSTSDETTLSALRSITAYSYISFSWNASGQCTRVYIGTTSRYLP